MRTRVHLRDLAVAAALWLGAAVSSEATVVTFEVASLGGNSYEYTYFVVNDTLGVDIEELAVYFDVDLFENLQTATAPADWDPLIIQPDPVLPDDGFLDVLALASGIAPGGSLGAFTIRTDFLGTGTPGRQPFEILDPSTFTVLDSGFTVPAGAGAVPEPAALWLLGLASGALGLLRRGEQGTSR
jgi:hypothetical protein